MSEGIRIYFDGQGIDAPAGATVLDALELINPINAAAVRRGERTLTDSRGLPADSDAKVYNGAIFRVVAARDKSAE